METQKLKDLKANFKSGKLGKHEYIAEAYKIHGNLFSYPEALRGTDVAKIEITPDGINFFTRSGLTLQAPPGDSRTTPIEAINFDEYESKDSNMIHKLVKDDDRSILDIGGNIGWYSLHIGKWFKKPKMYTFEPIPQTHGYLKKNVELNNLQNRIELHRMGLSKEPGSTKFFFYNEGSGNASMANVSGRADVTEVECKLSTVDLFCKERSLKVQFIKCDVEGAELFVFQGGLELLKTQKPIVFTELLRKWAKPFGYHPQDVVKLFSELGYGCFRATEAGELESVPEITEQTEETNFFFIPN